MIPCWYKVDILKKTHTQKEIVVYRKVNNYANSAERYYLGDDWEV